jgi:hypothetical protein
MMDADPGPMAGDPEDERRRLRRLVSALRANGGVGAIGAACHHDVPSLDGVVLTINAAHAGRIILSESGPHGDQLEDLHATLGEGPCIDAAVTGKPVITVDLEHQRALARWPRFAPQAPGFGIRAVFVYPVLLHAEPIGVLSAYREAAGPLSATDHEQVRRYGKAATVVLLDDLPATKSGDLHFVLPPLAGEVQQAVGIVMESAEVDAPTALHRLRAYARRSSRPMRDVVADVRTCRLPFDPSEAT